MGEVIAIMSEKNGIGKTTITANLGRGLAMMGKKVVLIDADDSPYSLDVIMGLENRIIYNLIDVFENICTIKQALIKDKYGFNIYLLASAQSNEMTAIIPEHMKILTDELKEMFDYVLIDCPSESKCGIKNAIASTNHALVVTEPEVSSLRDTDRLIGILEANKFEKIHLIVNKLCIDMVESGDMMSAKDVEEILAIELFGTIPYGCREMVAYMNICKHIIGDDFYPSKDLMKNCNDNFSLNFEFSWYDNQEKLATASGVNRRMVSMLIKDKKRVVLKDSGLPDSYLKRFSFFERHTKKVPIIIVKEGEKYLSFLCDEKIFDSIVCNKEQKVLYSGIHILKVELMTVSRVLLSQKEHKENGEYAVKKESEIEMVKEKKPNATNISRKERYMPIRFSDIIIQMLNNTSKSNFSGRFEEAWNNCFQWSIKDQYCVFHAASPEILTLEMYGIWTTWYFGENIRDNISAIHTRYQGKKLESVGDKIIEELWELFSNMYFRNYTLFLSSTYGEPDRNMSQPSYDVLRRIGETISKEFTINPQYDFCAYVPFIMPIIDDLDRALILTSY